MKLQERIFLQQLQSCSAFVDPTTSELHGLKRECGFCKGMKRDGILLSNSDQNRIIDHQLGNRFGQSNSTTGVFWKRFHAFNHETA
jgi:hypothetical protein